VTTESLTVALTFNKKKDVALKSGEPGDLYAEFDSDETIQGISKALKSAGHSVILVEADEDAYSKLKKLKDKIDIVFNIAEGLKGESRESFIPAICELLGIPYTGSGPLALALTLDKARTKEILKYHKIPSPKFQVFDKASEKLNSNMRFPLIIKPLREGSSKGIKDDCLVNNEKELKTRIGSMIRDYDQPAIAEEFIACREFTVGILGNEKPRILPIVEIKFDNLPNGMNKFDSYEAKWIYDNPKSGHDPLVCPAKLTNKLESKIKKVCLDAYRALDCKDWCRVDLRVRNGIPYILELNALPGMIPDPKENSRFPRAAFTAGMTYNQVINEVLNHALKRFKLAK
jgi:D-alanine-D-alanine ligase